MEMKSRSWHGLADPGKLSAFQIRCRRPPEHHSQFSLATTATPTTVRVVCNNTLAMALDGNTHAIKVPHNTRFDPDTVKKQLGIAVSGWDEFMYRMRHLAERKVQWHEALGYFMSVLCDTAPSDNLPEQLPNDERCVRCRSFTKVVAEAASLLLRAVLPAAYLTPSQSSSITSVVRATPNTEWILRGLAKAPRLNNVPWIRPCCLPPEIKPSIT
jgi:hypothetical protein